MTQSNVTMQKILFDVCKLRSAKVYMNIWLGSIMAFISVINNRILIFTGLRRMQPEIIILTDLLPNDI
jgi:cadmium resistance protein CadD (predicted permease)